MRLAGDFPTIGAVNHFKLFSATLLAASLLGGCGPPPDEQPPPPPPAKIRTTYRVISGVSMGAIGTAALGMQHPERFDALGILGGPLDAPLLLRTIDRFHLGGFCSRAELEALMAQDPSKLNDPAAIEACRQKPVRLTWEHEQNFNDWVFTTNGGTFDRNSYQNLFKDLSLAYGNLVYENPASPYAPPGVDVERVRNPPADYCTNPVRIPGFKNLEYNADGKYDAITFCDGQPRLWFCNDDQSIVDFCSDPANIASPLEYGEEEAFATTYCAQKGGATVANKGSHPLILLNHAGKVDACRLATRPMTVALALDMNGNGRRDFGEPVLNNGAERYDDVGVDGCADAFENGSGGCNAASDPAAVDPNKDNYDADGNVLGTEQNWMFDDGEPWRDHGLDGVPGTADVGEGNGQFDLNSGRKALFGYDARTNYKKLDAAGRARLNVLADGGIRDLFNFGLASKQVFSLVKHFRPETSALYRDFMDIPGMIDRNGKFDPWVGTRWNQAPSNIAVLYGKENPTDQDRIDGEGDHVGTVNQAIDRFFTLFNWSGAQWPNLEEPKAPFGGASYDERELVEWYDSAVLGAKRDYAMLLPPGYHDEANKDVRYPVLFLLHGYGMDPGDFVSSAIIADSQMTGDNPVLRPMIIVYPNGRCCFVNQATGARDCRENDDTGTYIGSLPGYTRECASGSFYVNRRGYTAEDATRYGDAFFELMDHLDSKYRTLQAVDVEVR